MEIGQKLVRNRNRNSQRLSCIVRNFAGTRTATLKPDTRGQLIGQVMVRISRGGFRAITLKILMAIVKDKRRVRHTYRPGYFAFKVLAILVTTTIIRDRLEER